MEIERVILDTVDSTNSFAKREGKSFSKEALTVITAEEQTGGRGRLKRPWHSPRSKNLLVTFTFFLKSPVPDLPRIGQVLSLSVYDALRELQFQPQIKWPNDLLLHKKKVAGILTEIVEESELRQVVLGVGLNVNVDEAWLKGLDQPATSLFMESKKTWDREDLLARLQNRFLGRLEKFQLHGFAPFEQEFLSRVAYLGETIRYGNEEGVFESIASDGSLCLRLKDGSLKKILSAE